MTLPDAEIDHQSQPGPKLPVSAFVSNVRFREGAGFTDVSSASRLNIVDAVTGAGTASVVSVCAKSLLAAL